MILEAIILQERAALKTIDSGSFFLKCWFAAQRSYRRSTVLIVCFIYPRSFYILSVFSLWPSIIPFGVQIACLWPVSAFPKWIWHPFVMTASLDCSLALGTARVQLHLGYSCPRCERSHFSKEQKTITGGPVLKATSLPQGHRDSGLSISWVLDGGFKISRTSLILSFSHIPSLGS